MNNFFDYIAPIFKYLQSIRNVIQEGKPLLTIDMRFPIKWEVKKYIDSKDGISVKLQQSTDQIALYSFITLFNEEKVNELFNKVVHIMDKNVEEEKKRELLDKKINELQNQFKQQLDDLKNKFSELPLEELKNLSLNEKEHLQSTSSES